MDEQATGLRALMQQARNQGADALGIGNDPEAWQILGDMARERYLEHGELRDLETWCSLVQDVSSVEWLDAISQDWLVHQLVLLPFALEALEPPAVLMMQYSESLRRFAANNPTEAARVVRAREAITLFVTTMRAFPKPPAAPGALLHAVAKVLDRAA